VRLHVNAVGLVMGGGLNHLSRFLPALAAVRPDWEVTVYLSLGVTAPEIPGVRVVRVNRTSWRRLGWDSVTVGRRAASSGADALLNLANYGPLAPPLPSVLYQRNPIYFDPRWVGRQPARWRADARLRRELAFAAMRRSAAVLVPSEGMAGYLRAWRSCPSHTPVEVVPHAVDTSRFSFAPTVPTGRVRVVSLSLATPHKDQGLLIDLAGALVARGVDVEVEATIADEDAPGYVASLRDKLRRSGVADRVRFVGRVAAPTFLSAAHVSVLPSITESFGFAVIESMASGVPVVASRIPSSVEVLGDLGWYFEPGDALGAAEQVLDVLATEPDVLLRRLERARSVAVGYTWERNATSVAAIIERAVGIRREGGDDQHGA